MYLFQEKKHVFIVQCAEYHVIYSTLQCVQNITLHCCEVLSYFSSFSPVCMCSTTDTQRIDTTHTLHNNYAQHTHTHTHTHKGTFLFKPYISVRAHTNMLIHFLCKHTHHFILIIQTIHPTPLY